MPLRRCPHCKGLSNFTLGIPVHMRDSTEVVQLDICQNCGKPTYYRYPSEEQTHVILDAYPKLDREPDEELPEGVKIAFGEALKSLNGGIFNGCVTICKRALEEAMQDLGAKGDSLSDQIDSLEVSQGITPTLKEWAQEPTLEESLAAHGSKGKRWADKTDAEQIVEFSRWLFHYAYVFPKRLEDTRRRFGKQSPS